MTINPHPVTEGDGMPLYEQPYTDLEDFLLDAINSRFDLEDGDVDPIDVVAAVMEDLFKRYEVLRKATICREAPALAPGQLWRNRGESRRLVRITDVADWRGTRYVFWEAVTGRGPSRSEVRADLWTNRYEFVEDPR